MCLLYVSCLETYLGEYLVFLSHFCGGHSWDFTSTESWSVACKSEAFRCSWFPVAFGASWSTLPRSSISQPPMYLPTGWNSTSTVTLESQHVSFSLGSGIQDSGGSSWNATGAGGISCTAVCERFLDGWLWGPQQTWVITGPGFHSWMATSLAGYLMVWCVLSQCFEISLCFCCHLDPGRRVPLMAPQLSSREVFSSWGISSYVRKQLDLGTK